MRQENKFDFIGEIGLDRGKKGNLFSKQCLVFESMLDVAQDIQKSVCVHIVQMVRGLENF